MPSGRLLPASFTHSAMNSGMRASSWSAACSRMAARLAAGVRFQPGCAATALASAFCTVAASAACHWPTTSRVSAGLVTGSDAPVGFAPGTSGAACQGFTAALSCSARARSSLSLARLAPMEFFLSWFWLRSRSTGSGILGCGIDSNEDTISTGSRTRSAIGTRSSVMRLTKLELAPFSSRRRTRYGSRSSCEPTGA
ncbi:hypothetical protein D3C71_1215910 [compost metagenome]